MSDYKLEFVLKQHTPLIHFQGEQHGATLRATELKPKLDRFIITQLGNGDYEVGKEEAKRRRWLIGQGDHPALDYKARIMPLSKVQNHLIDLCQYSFREDDKIKRNKKGKKIPMPFPNFFAALGDECKQFDKFFSFADKIKVTMLTFNSSLKKYIEMNLLYFFTTTNFGTRQSKGFGSFYIDEHDKMYRPIEESIQSFSQEQNFWAIEVQTNEDIKKRVHDYYVEYGVQYSLFSAIELFYKTLRSGLNYPDKDGETRFYFKSLLHKYMTEVDIYDTWDKAVIKASFIDGANEKYENILSRDMLGLSTIHEYRKDNFTVRHPNKKTDNESRYPENKIKRFKSPILFKPIHTSENKYKIYITYDQNTNSEILGEELLILKVNNKKILQETTITLPNAFDINSYLINAFSTDIKQHIESHQKANSKYVYADQEESMQLQGIYRSLREVRS